MNTERLKKQLLYIEDGPSTFTEMLRKQKYIEVVFIRFKHMINRYSDEYLEKTKNENIFWIDIMLPIEHEIERFKNWQNRKAFNVEFFLNPSEIAQYYAQAFARLLGLQCLTEEQTFCCKNKIAMKQKLKSIGLNVADYKTVFTSEDIVIAGECMGWPVVLKPTEDSSCKDTYLLHDRSEVLSVDLNSKHQWIVEEYIDLDEYAVDIIIYNHEILGYFITKYPVPLLKSLDGDINANISIRHVEEYRKRKIEMVMNTYISGMNIENGCIHMEYLLTRIITR